MTLRVFWALNTSRAKVSNAKPRILTVSSLVRFLGAGGGCTSLRTWPPKARIHPSLTDFPGSTPSYVSCGNPLYLIQPGLGSQGPAARPTVCGVTQGAMLPAGLHALLLSF